MGARRAPLPYRQKDEYTRNMHHLCRRIAGQKVETQGKEEATSEEMAHKKPGEILRVYFGRYVTQNLVASQGV